MAPSRTLDPTEDEVIVTVELPEIDGLTAPRFRHLVRGRLAELGRPVVFVIDLSAVRSMGSAGVAVLILAREMLHPFGSDLILRNVAPPVRRTLDLLGFSQRFDFD